MKKWLTKCFAWWNKFFIWGLVIGAIVTMIIGFNWGGWVTGGTAEKMASDQTNDAIVAALTQICVQNFKNAPGAMAQFKELSKDDSWKLREIVQQGKWAVVAPNETPNEKLADACAKELLMTKK